MCSVVSIYIEYTVFIWGWAIKMNKIQLVQISHNTLYKLLYNIDMYCYKMKLWRGIRP